MKLIQPAYRRMLGVLLTVAMFGTLAVTTAEAKPRAKAIKSPRANQTVRGMLKIRPNVQARKGPYVVTIRINGRLYDRQRSATRRIAGSYVPIDTTELKNRRHRLTITVQAKSKPRKVTQTIRFRVKNRKRGPAGAGQRAPNKRVGKFVPLVAENFTKRARTGSFDPDSIAWDAPSYVGATGTPWIAYPSWYLDTFLRHPYRAKQVLSVHDGVLDYHLRQVNGRTAGASLSPVLPHGTQYQTYGRWSVRMRISSTNLNRFHAVFLLWPHDNSHWEYAESDFPETRLVPGRRVIEGFSHFDLYSQQERIATPPIDLREWHVYTQEWTPTARKYYLDGKLLHTTKHPIWHGPMRWEMQIQTYGSNGKQQGHLYVDWASVWGWAG